MRTSGPPVRVVLAGIGGMGWVYLKALLDGLPDGRFEIAGAVDPSPERSPGLAILRHLGIPVFAGLDEFYDRFEADLAVISSPIQFHAGQTILALERGSRVLCEKPVAGTIQEARAMAEAERRTGRWAAVGYQWSFSRAVQDLKADILRGRFGRPLRLRCLYPWPRDLAYYGRNDWAGRKRDGSGGWVLDSPANNAMAHDLHNMFYLLGPSPAESARPAFVQAELYRAYPIENFDTAAARITTEFGTEVLFYVSHVPASDPGPVFEFEFESGTVHGRGRGGSLRGRFADGTETDYGSPDTEPLRKLDLALAEARTDRPPVCGIAAATSQTLCLNGMQDSSPDIAPFPADVVERRGVGPAERLVVTGLDEALTACYEGRRLPSEIGLDWARPGTRIDLRDYRSFPSRDPGLGLDGLPGKDGR